MADKKKKDMFDEYYNPGKTVGGMKLKDVEKKRAEAKAKAKALSGAGKAASKAKKIIKKKK